LQEYDQIFEQAIGPIFKKQKKKCSELVSLAWNQAFLGENLDLGWVMEGISIFSLQTESQSLPV